MLGEVATDPAGASLNQILKSSELVLMVEDEIFAGLNRVLLSSSVGGVVLFWPFPVTKCIKPVCFWCFLQEPKLL